MPHPDRTLDGTIDQLDNEYEDVTRSLNLAKAEADSLNTQINGSSANLGPLQSQVNAAETEAEQVERRRAAYEDLLTACNRWAAGRFDAGVFKENWRFSTKVESQYLARATPPSPPTSASLTSSTLLDLFDVAEYLRFFWALHRVAEQETRRISDQIDRVNTGLGAVEFNRGTRLTLRATPRQLTAVAELTEIVRSISRRIAEVGLGDKQAILDQYADILRLRNRLASTAPEDKAWTRDALDVRNRFTFDCAEWDVSNEELIRTHSNAGDNSGGEQEKLMAFCLAGALSFNLASPESADNRPVFAQLMLDEAFSKSDPQFAQQALQAFRKFGFQLVIVATVQNATTIQPYIDSVVMVSKTETTGRNTRPVASVATRTISEFTSLRNEMRATAERVPARGVTSFAAPQPTISRVAGWRWWSVAVAVVVAVAVRKMAR